MRIRCAVRRGLRGAAAERGERAAGRAVRRGARRVSALQVRHVLLVPAAVARRAQEQELRGLQALPPGAGRPARCPLAAGSRRARDQCALCSYSHSYYTYSFEI